MFNIMENLKDNILTLTIDLGKPGRLSKSGKSIVVASSEGNVGVDGAPDTKMGVNIYTSKP